MSVGKLQLSKQLIKGKSISAKPDLCTINMASCRLEHVWCGSRSTFNLSGNIFDVKSEKIGTGKGRT